MNSQNDDDDHHHLKILNKTRKVIRKYKNEKDNNVGHEGNEGDVGNELSESTSVISKKGNVKKRKRSLTTSIDSNNISVTTKAISKEHQGEHERGENSANDESKTENVGKGNKGKKSKGQGKGKGKNNKNGKKINKKKIKREEKDEEKENDPLDDLIANSEALQQRMTKYERGEKVSTKGIRNKKLKSKIEDIESQAKQNAVHAARAEALLLLEKPGVLQVEDPMDKTYKVTQDDIVRSVDMNTAIKKFKFDLSEQGMGAYESLRYTRNGRHLLVGSKYGHIFYLDNLKNSILCEMNVKERVRDVQTLHSHDLFAVAQEKYVFIYESQTGAEVHCLRSHIRPTHLEFLPYHFLLSSVGQAGFLKYQDISTGELVAELRTDQGECNVMRQNPWNAVLALGHNNGTVTMWGPNIGKPLAKMFTHKGPVKSLAVDQSGNYLVTGGLDGMVKVWDLRTFQKLHSYHTPRFASSMDISQRGLLSMCCGYQTLIWQDAIKEKAISPYLRHSLPGHIISESRFRPYEDILGLGYDAGVESIIVPGSGEPNYDSMEANPFETKKQRQEREVHSLLEKLRPEMIDLKVGSLGNIRDGGEDVPNRRIELLKSIDVNKGKSWKGQQLTSDSSEHDDKDKATSRSLSSDAAKIMKEAGIWEKKKMKGKGKIGSKIKRKNRNIITVEREARREALARAEKERRFAKDNANRTIAEIFSPSQDPALVRFLPKAQVKALRKNQKESNVM